MERREVLKYAAGLATLAALKPAAASDSMVEFSPELYAEMLENGKPCLLYTSPSPRDKRQPRMPSSA